MGGGSRNTANARHAVAAGYKAITKAQLSFAAGFAADIEGPTELTDTDVECKIGADDDYTIKFCASTVLFNEIDVLELMETSRRLTEVSERATELAERLSELGAELTLQRANFFDQMAAQTAILESQAKQLE